MTDGDIDLAAGLLREAARGGQARLHQPGQDAADERA
jgi:hypothetical protein